MKGDQALQRCYERSLRTNPALDGSKTLVLSITIAPTGATMQVDVRPPLDPKLVECFSAEIKGWIFPKFEGGPVTVEQRMTLTPV